MDWKALIKVEIDKGFSKTTIEKLSGLPKNNLASALSGNRELSKVGLIKVERWLSSEKPDPLTLILPKKKKAMITDLNKSTNEIKSEQPLGDKKSNYTVDTTGGNEEILIEIKRVMAETIPAERNTPMGKRVWEAEKSNRISILKSKMR